MALAPRQNLDASSVIASRLLAWYDRHGRRLPWRAPPGMRPDPYRVWLSEIMLQQTSVAAVTPYFERFVHRWPTVESLAAAAPEEVLAAWAGLGYYARARNLHRCAGIVQEVHGGLFPDSPEDLRKLPGIGAYTAAAIAAIAFGRPTAAVDGNVERVMARLFAVTTPLPSAKRDLARLAAALVPCDRPGDFAQALMDLGATICVPRRPKCRQCPLVEGCAAASRGLAPELPRKSPRAARPTRYGIAYCLSRSDGKLLLRRRPEDGLLGGMLEVPTTVWRSGRPTASEARREAPAAVGWRVVPGTVRHTFTHFHLELTVWVGQGDGEQPGGRWVSLDDLSGQALPSVMRKVIAHALKHPD